MPFLELFDETLDINSTENYILSVQAGRDGLAFCLLDTLRNKYILIRSFEPDESRYFSSGQVEELIRKDDFLMRRYKQTILTMPSGKFTLVPSQLYDPGKKDELFAFNHVTDDDTIILANRITEPDSFLLFGLSKSLSSTMGTFYSGVYPCHHLKPLMEHIRHVRKNSGKDYIHVHVERDFFNLVIFRNRLLKLCNTYSYRNVSDIMYFILNAFRTLEIGQDETIHLSGITEKYDDLYSNLSLYVREVRFSEPSGNFTFSYVFDDTGLHRFIGLFTAVNCV